MINFRMANVCAYNMLYTKFNQDMGTDKYFYYDLEYPTFYNFKNTYFNTNPNVLNGINEIIKLDTYTFKEGVFKESQEANESDENKEYKVFVNFNVPFNKNYVLSSTLGLMAFVEGEGVLYNQLNNYNYDLTTGNVIYLKDIFNPNVNYTKVVEDYIKYKISQNKDLYYPDVDVAIPEDQAFYLTDEGVVVYFGLDELGPKELGIPKFKLTYSKFAPYFKPRFFCTANNVTI